MIKIRLLSCAAGMLMSFAVFAQETKIPILDPAASSQNVIPKNEFGIDATQIMPLFRRQENSYLVNYKRYLGADRLWAIRAGLNLDIGTSTDQSREISFKLGTDRQKLIGEKWWVYFGADASYSNTSYNDRPNTIERYGISPLLGFRFHFCKNFSLGTEPHLNFFYHIFHDPNSFSKNSDIVEKEVSIGSVGQVLVNFHF